MLVDMRPCPIQGARGREWRSGEQFRKCNWHYSQHKETYKSQGRTNNEPQNRINNVCVDKMKKSLSSILNETKTKQMSKVHHLELQLIVHTHRTSCQGGWSRGFVN